MRMALWENSHNSTVLQHISEALFTHADSISDVFRELLIFMVLLQFDVGFSG